MLKKVLLLLIIAGLGSWFYVNFFQLDNTDWQDVSPGVEWKKIPIEGAGFLKTDAEVVVLRLDPSRVHVETGKTQTAEQWRQSTKSIAAVNGGFFDEKNVSLGLRESEGKELSSLRRANWGVFFVRNGKAQIMHTRDFRKTDSTSITEAIQSGPRLVVDGQPTDLKDQWARRTGIGIAPDGKVLIAACDSDLSLRQWADFWAAKEGLDCRHALNLDGGGSTQLSLKSDTASFELSGLWPVPDALVVR